MPPLTMAYLVVCVCSYLACMISCASLDGSMFCYVFDYLTLIPERVYQHGEVWRLLTCHVAPYSLWSMIWFTLYVVFICYGIEKRIGTGRMALLMLSCMLSISLICSAVAAFFGLIPGINSWSYFTELWYDSANTGQSSLLMALTIIICRAVGLKRASMCCFEMPLWLFYTLLFLMCQLMMYPCWYGFEYNIGGLLTGFLFPVKAVPGAKGGLGFLEGRYGAEQGQQDQQRGYYEFNGPDAEQPAPKKDKRFAGQSRTL